MLRYRRLHELGRASRAAIWKLELVATRASQSAVQSPIAKYRVWRRLAAQSRLVSVFVSARGQHLAPNHVTCHASDSKLCGRVWHRQMGSGFRRMTALAKWPGFEREGTLVGRIGL